ncbi:translation initiation factor IF-2-like [Sinocyclocheilus rhinocerous]|uniref:translation initiation factor IF-2-like n=1 Tax=Sinocyclocheilus rhinocerous TaxID=307959 RepID=UPI0007BA7B5E|nr:PREDICTED: translation initiation factor IF-2-like [Sinocyclocheilus rhinocerous]
MQLGPQSAAAWRGSPRLPSRACRFSSALTAKAYSAAGQAASALHAMALLQVHQAKALKQLHEGGADSGGLQELRTATDLALRATKVTAQALGQTMSTLVVQERHLWLTLADMREADKHRFLDSPISQAGLFGEAVEGSAQQFSAAQKQTEASQYILPRRSAAVATPPPAAAPLSARRRERPPVASISAPARPQQQPSQRPQRGAGRRKAAQPVSAPAKPVKRQGGRRPCDVRPGVLGSSSSGGGDRTTPSPGGGPGGETFVPGFFYSATGYPASGAQNLNRRAGSFFSGFQEGEEGSARDPVSTWPSPSPFANGQQGSVQGRYASSRAPCPAVEPGKWRAAHSDPTLGRTASRVGSLCSTALPHCGYVGG